VTFWQRIAAWLTMDDEIAAIRNEIHDVQARAAFETAHFSELLHAREVELVELRADTAQATIELAATITVLRDQLSAALAERDLALAILKAAIAKKPACIRCHHMPALHDNGPCEGAIMGTAGLERCGCVAFEAKTPPISPE
jgi:hypothetical protein